MIKNYNQASTFVELYNSAYNSYLSRIDPNIFLHTLLNDLVRMINGRCGVVMGYDAETCELNLMTHVSSDSLTDGAGAGCQTTTDNHQPDNCQMNVCPTNICQTNCQKNDMHTDTLTTSDPQKINNMANPHENLWLTFSNYIRKHKTLSKTSLIMKHIEDRQIGVKNLCTVSEILGVQSNSDTLDPLSEISSESINRVINTVDPADSDVSILSNIKKGSVTFLPFSINDTSNGMMMICSDDICTDHNRSLLQSKFKAFCTMMGVLFNSMMTIPLHIDRDTGNCYMYADRSNAPCDSFCIHPFNNLSQNSSDELSSESDEDDAQHDINQKSKTYIHSHNTHMSIAVSDNRDSECHDPSENHREDESSKLQNVKDDRFHSIRSPSNKSTVRRSVFTNIDHSITYQIVHDTLNIVADIIVITDRDMRIIYKNENFVALVKNRYPDKIIQKTCNQACNNSVSKTNYVLPEYLIDIIPQTISLIANSMDQNTSSFYRNKKLEIDVKNSDSMLEMYVNSTVSCGGTYHILRIYDKEICKDPTKDSNEKMYNNSKNLIAYLSHELRNPIQAISTGVYIIDRAIKNLDRTQSDKIVDANKKKLLKSIRADELEAALKDATGTEMRTISNLDSADSSPTNSPEGYARGRSLSKPDIFKNKQSTSRKGSDAKQYSPSSLKPNKRSYIDVHTEDMNKGEHKTFGTIEAKNATLASETEILFVRGSSSSDIDDIKDILVINECDHEDIVDCTKDCITSCDPDSALNLMMKATKTSTYRSIDSLNESLIFVDDNDDTFSNDVTESILIGKSKKLTNSEISCDTQESSGSSLDSIDDINLDSDEISTLRSVIKRVFSACKNMNIIIDDILDLSKIDNDELIMNLDEHALQEITDLIIAESESEATKKGLQLEYEFDENNPEFIYTDSTRIFQILSNLISNSIKYSNTGVIKFKVSYDGVNNNVIFQVTDQGRGIRKEEISNLFKQFGRTSNSVTDINSTGLGLCVCQKIANLLGGSIEVTSEYRKGSTFTFVHPIKLGYSGSGLELEQVPTKYIKGKILIVDDDPNITSLFKLLLRCMNYDRGYDLTIETAGTGDKALQLAKTKTYDLIFMDIDLDGEDGCTVCEQIHSDCELNRTSPVVAVTANIKSVQHDRDPKFNKFDDVILKPFNNKDINKIIVKYLGR